jgi:predicted transcriptional regulator
MKYGTEASLAIERAVLRDLMTGPARMDDLAHWLNVPRRDVELAVQALRLAGEPIVSDGNGLRYSTDPAEVRECAQRLRSRLATQAVTTRAMLRTARRMEQPKEMVLGL